MKKIILFSILGMLITAQSISQGVHISITERGALPDGYTDNAVVIQKVIDEVHAKGGGVVQIPRGRFVTGVIRLRSNVELNIHPEGVLLASTDRFAYGPSMRASGWIIADSAVNIAITGKGLLDGQSDLLMADIYDKLRSGALKDPEWKTFNAWHQRRPVENNRPRMIRFSFCDSVRIQQVRIQNGTSWVQDYRNCSNMLIEDIDVFSNTFLNNDGIDLTDCKNAIIRHCNVNAADDGICIKSSMRSSRSENISVSNCRVRSSACAIKLGTASQGGFRNISVRDIEVYDTYRSAIAIEAVDGGIAENIDVRNIHAVNTGNAIFIRLGHRNNDAQYSQLKNVYIGDVTVQVPKGKPDSGYTHDGPELRIASNINTDTIIHGKPLWYYYGIDSTAAKYPHNIFPSSITGIPGHPVENVTLENISIYYESGAEKFNEANLAKTLKDIPEVEKDYPEFSMFGELPAWGFFIRHADGITLKNIRLETGQKDYRIPVITDDVKSLSITKMEIPKFYSLHSMVLSNSSVKEISQVKKEVKSAVISQ
jgi:hypothetical protein